MDFKEYFSKQKKVIEKRMLTFLRSERQALNSVDRWGSDVIERLDLFLQNGKKIRGGLVLLSHEMYQGQSAVNALNTACCLELIHASLLIHDDILDRDAFRRGRPSIFSQYAGLAKKEGMEAPDFFGQSMGMVAGDIGFFLALKFLESSREKINKTIIDEIIFVCLGQMMDFYLGQFNESPTLSQIKTVYKYKTARYTFSLPLKLGAMLANKKKALDLMDNLGEYMGLIFQIKDDYIGIYSDANTIGKPIGSDIRENKKTIFSFYLFNKATKSDKKLLKDIFGKKELVKSEIDIVRNLMGHYQVEEEVNKLLDEYAGQAALIIRELPGVNNFYKSLLFDLLDYGLKRQF